MSQSSNREEALFRAAAELEPGQARRAFLDSACGSDPALRQRLEALLAAHDQPDTLLATHPEPLNPIHPDETVGLTLGRYKLLEKVGEGGCGVVYVAEQTEPVRRRVALKVIKLGMDTKQVVARFEAERQALAMMDHPNIAKVLDAGTTETGRPYFVMELVRGIKITDYCDQANLSTKDRLDLFIKVCHAIQHAHQKGIIHRDIKPSNILVTLHDGLAVPKVIDFGIAKATEGRLTDSTVYTQLHQFIGTPAYMSPEQAEMSGLDIDTRSDIYSLGVLLYELLTGSTPFDAKELISQGIDAMRRTIREKEPVRPSTRLATLKGEELTTTAKCRSSDLPKLIHLLKRDLDWIVMKCLEKDRTRRYETANGLAADINRHLTNEPVVARPPSAGYRLRKLIQRHRMVFAAGGAVTAAIVGGLGVSLWLLVGEKAALRRAVAAEQAAKREAAQREQVARFLGEIVTGGSPEFAKDGDTALLRRILDRASERLDSEGGSQPSERYNLALAYEGLGDYAKAEALVREALGAVAPNSSSALDYRRELLDLLFAQQKHQEAEKFLTEALLATPEGSPERIDLLSSRGGVLARRGKWKEALTDLRMVVALDPGNRESHHLLAALLLQNGDAEGYSQHRQSQLNTFASTDDPIVAERSAKSCLILPLTGSGMHVVSEWTDTALAAGTSHWAWMWFESAKGLAEYRQGEFAAAVSRMGKVLTQAGIEPSRDVQASMVLAMAHHRLGDEAKARAALTNGQEIARTRLPKQGSADLGAGWVDWIIAHALLREATTLIGGSSKPERGTAAKSESAKGVPK